MVANESSIKLFLQENNPLQPLPSYITRTNAGLLKAPGVVEGKEGPYTAMVDFGYSRSAYDTLVPAAERIKTDTKRTKFIGFADEEVVKAMHNVTEINAEGSPANDDDRLGYQTELFKAFEPIAKEVKQNIEGRAVFLPPLNGGDLIQAFFQIYKVIENPNDAISIEFKRLLLNDGRLLVGAIEKHYPQGKFDTGVFIDDCLATDVSAYVGLLLLLKNYPDLKRFVVAVSAATQRGTEGLERDWKRIDLLIKAGVPVFQMTSNHYMLRTEEEGYPAGTYFVGDMGKWAAPLPHSYDNKAPWNALR